MRLLWVATLLIATTALAEPQIFPAPLSAYPTGQVRMSRQLCYDGRDEARHPNGELLYTLLYFPGPTSDEPLGELTFRTDGSRTIKWGRIDSHDPGKGVAFPLYQTAVASEPFRHAD